MYQVFCMKDTPPLTWEEQDRCLHSKTSCWRQANCKKQAEVFEAAEEAEPVDA